MCVALGGGMINRENLLAVQQPGRSSQKRGDHEFINIK